MKRSLSNTLLALAATALLGQFYTSVSYAKGPEFQATMVSEYDGERSRMKVYMSGKKMRTEPVGVGEDTATIVRQDKKVVWVLMHSERAYMEMPISGRQMAQMGTDDHGATRTPLGDEPVDGRPCSKELVTVTGDDGSVEESYHWVDKKLGFAIKAEAADGSWGYVYEDIEVGKQDAELFEVPGHYIKMDMGGRYPDYRDYPGYPDAPDVPDVPRPYVPGPW